jgi:hypothetical protein
MMTSSRRPAIIICIVILLIPVIALQTWIDPRRHQFEPSISNVNEGIQQLPIEFALGAVIGFREAVAGLLWVRTDEFFDEGNYDAIVPMVRIITWLDPHNLDVYQTGAWHLDYNFTDSEQRSDRRYIPFSLALSKEGVANNPTITDLYADLAFTHYMRKIEDFPASVEWYNKAMNLTRKDPVTGKVMPVQWDPTIVGHGLAHAYQACGDTTDEIAAWQKCADVLKPYYLKNTQDSQMQQAYSTTLKNLNELKMRIKWRKTMTQPPVNLHFSAKLIRIAPMVFVVQGTMNTIGATAFDLETGDHTGLPNATKPSPGEHTWGLVDGARVEFRLQDADYVMPNNVAFGLNFAPPRNITILQDSASVQGGKFKRQFDMSKDHTGDDAMYSFYAPKYTFTLWFNPGNPNDCPPNLSDRLGWIGEGMTDDKYLYTGGLLPGTGGSKVPSLRMIEEQFTLTREDIMGSGIKEFTNGQPVPATGGLP